MENGNQSCLLTSPLLVTVNWGEIEIVIIMITIQVSGIVECLQDRGNRCMDHEATNVMTLL